MGRTTEELRRMISTEEFAGRLKAIYCDEALVPVQQLRYQQALQSYEDLFGCQEAEIYSAPGRSEVGGNHTDHQYGKVLATSLNLDFIAVVHPLEEPVVELKSEGYDMIRVDLTKPEPDSREYGTTDALVRGMAAGLVERGYRIGGFRAYVTSDVPGGAGMSSSAALEILIGTILSGLYNDGKAGAVELARIGQQAENVFFGKPCGLMDQMACSVGGLIRIDFADPKAPVTESVQVDFSRYGHSLCITDTKGSHADLTDDYAAIPQEMKKIAAHYGKEVLRQVDEERFRKDLPELRQAYGDRAVLRALHFFRENARVDAQCRALEAGDFEAFKKLIRASGRSSYMYLQNVYSNKDVTAQGLSLALCISEQVLGEDGAYRIHGGGFAGTIQAFVPEEKTEEYRMAMDDLFGPGSCLVLKVRPYGGIRVI